MNPNEEKRELREEAREMRKAERIMEHEAHEVESEAKRELKHEERDERKAERHREHERDHDHTHHAHGGHPHEHHEHRHHSEGHDHHPHERHDMPHHGPERMRFAHEESDARAIRRHERAEHNGCAIVTGSGQGIGAAIARRLAADGFPIVLNCPNEALLPPTHEVAQMLKAEHDARVITIMADVSDMDQVKAMVDEALEEFGAIDVLVNNAGITRDKLIARMSPEDFNDVISINLNGTFHCCKAVTRPMMKQRYGRIISLSSVVGVHGNAGQANYAASKAGIIGLTKSLAKELAPRNITVNAIAPGFIKSPMTDALTDEQRAAIASQIGLGRFGLPEDVAHLVSFLASNEASYITGQVIGIDGGMGA